MTNEQLAHGIEHIRKRLLAFWAVTFAPLGLRTLILGALALWLLSHDWQAAKSFMFGMGLVCAGLTFLHWYRKSQHPYLDLKKLTEKAAEDPMASAILMLGVFGFMSGILIFLLFVVVK